MIEMTVPEFISAIGTTVKYITNDKKTEGVTQLPDGKTVNVYNVALSGNFSYSNCFPYSIRNADLTGLNTSKVTSMYQMFYNCQNLESVNLSSFDISGITEGLGVAAMFFNCVNLKSLDLTSFILPSTCYSMGSMFTGCSSLKELDLSTFNTKNIFNMYRTFDNCNIPKLYINTSIWTKGTFKTLAEATFKTLAEATSLTFYDKKPVLKYKKTRLATEYDLIKSEKSIRNRFSELERKMSDSPRTLYYSAVADLVERESDVEYINDRVFYANVDDSSEYRLAINFHNIGEDGVFRVIIMNDEDTDEIMLDFTVYTTYYGLFVQSNFLMFDEDSPHPTIYAQGQYDGDWENSYIIKNTNDNFKFGWYSADTDWEDVNIMITDFYGMSGNRIEVGNLIIKVINIL